jgi:hypothetical protein
MKKICDRLGIPYLTGEVSLRAVDGQNLFQLGKNIVDIVHGDRHFKS